MALKIALVGNPNSGKSTLFNALTGSNQYVGNWPGVTVEKKLGKLKSNREVELCDLPGIYSLSPYTLEEIIARDFILEEKPDAVINIVDASNLERNLYLTTQLLELGVPMVVALNMIDVVNKRGDNISVEKLSQALGCPVVCTSALKGTGTEKVAQAAIEAAKHGQAKPKSMKFDDDLESALCEIEDALPESIEEANRRFYSIKLFERDEKIVCMEGMPDVEGIIADIESQRDDVSESIITTARYDYIGGIVKKCLKKHNKNAMTASDKIDRVVTNRWLALPIFVAVMFAVYYIAVTSVGAIVTDFTNDVLFGEWICPGVGALLEGIGTADWLVGLIVDGIVGGVGSVIGFVPQMLVLFLLLACLEQCGYMARVAFIMDRIFRKFGLSGKSFIPMLIGSGCGVPGIMASRTIENERDRRMTVMTTTFIPCGAKMPIIALIAGALFGGAWWVAPSAYFIGIIAVIVSGIMLKKTKMFRGEAAPFVMELPSYHLPTVSGVLRSTWERGWSFIKRAGTVILAASILIWFLSNFGVVDGVFCMVEDMDESILALIGGFVSYIFMPLGFGNWQSTVATMMGLVAKEEVVGVFGALYGVAGDALELVEEGIFSELGPIAAHFTALSAYSFMLFNLLCPPCFAAIGAMRREMNSSKWTWFAIGYQLVFAYAVSFAIYQIGLLFTGAAFSVATGIACLVIAGFLYFLFRPNRYNKHYIQDDVNVRA